MVKFRLIYDVKENAKKLKLFDKIFFRFHNRKYKMIINNKLLDLVEEYETQENNLQNSKVKLKYFIIHT